MACLPQTRQDSNLRAPTSSRELFTDPGNNAVVRTDVAEIMQVCDQGDINEARECTALLLADLDGLLAEAHGQSGVRRRLR